MFTDPPGCFLHRQASFIAAQPAFEGQEAGVDYDWFPLPPIDQEGTLYGGELTVVGTPLIAEAKDFLERFIAEDVQCEMGGVQASSRISPNVDVGPDCYTDELLAGASEVLTEALEAGTGRFDASDLMPAEVGSGIVLDRHDRVHPERPGIPGGGPRRHRGELAVVLTGRPS